MSTEGRTQSFSNGNPFPLTSSRLCSQLELNPPMEKMWRATLKDTHKWIFLYKKRERETIFCLMTAQSGWVKIWVMSLPNLFFLGAMLLNAPKPIFISQSQINRPQFFFPAGGVNVMSATSIFYFFSHISSSECERTLT